MVIASKTGWTEECILWQLPLSRGYAYYHTARLMEGELTQWPGQTSATEEWLHDLQRWATTAPH